MGFLRVLLLLRVLRVLLLLLVVLLLLRRRVARVVVRVDALSEQPAVVRDAREHVALLLVLLDREAALYPNDRLLELASL